MTKAIFRLGLELCDEVDRLAPMTRPKRSKTVDLTASSLTLRSERLRVALENVFAGKSTKELSPVDEIASRILAEVSEWLARGDARADAAATGQLVRERAELFLSLYRRATTSPPTASTRG